MDTPIPLIAVILMGLAGVWFTRAVMQDEWVKNVAKGGWAPLVRLYPFPFLLLPLHASFFFLKRVELEEELMTDWSNVDLEWNRNGTRRRSRSV